MTRPTVSVGPDLLLSSKDSLQEFIDRNCLDATVNIKKIPHADSTVRVSSRPAASRTNVVYAISAELEWLSELVSNKDTPLYIGRDYFSSPEESLYYALWPTLGIAHDSYIAAFVSDIIKLTKAYLKVVTTRYTRYLASPAGFKNSIHVHESARSLSGLITLNDLLTHLCVGNNANADSLHARVGNVVFSDIAVRELSETFNIYLGTINELRQ
jgi:hypothetical protein